MIWPFVRRTPQQQFWAWFVANAHRFSGVLGRPLLEELSRQLKRVNEGLTFELLVDSSPNELVISADGIKSVFPAVEALARASPPIPGWRVVAFRPRKPDRPLLKIDGVTWDAETVLYRCTAAAEGRLDVRLYVEGFREEEKTRIATAVYLLLDSILGEYDTEMRLGLIEFAPLPADASLFGLRRLPELVFDVDRAKPPPH